MNTNLREVQHDTIDGDVYQYFESLVDKIIKEWKNRYGSKFSKNIHTTSSNS